jgi:hypothetical protein
MGWEVGLPSHILWPQETAVRISGWSKESNSRGQVTILVLMELVMCKKEEKALFFRPIFSNI